MLLEAQRVVLSQLMAPIECALRALSTKAMRSMWRGAPSASARSQQEVEDEQQLSAAMLVFSASPLPYITQVGEHLLSLPQLLMPFGSSNVLSDIQAELCPAAKSARALAEEDSVEPDAASSPANAAIGWIHCVAEATASLLVEAVSAIPALSPLGAKQLAADAGYLDNILSAGLALRPHPQLAELQHLLTCDVARMPPPSGVLAGVIAPARRAGQSTVNAHI